MNGTLLQYECRLSGGDAMRWLGHSNLTLCNIICSNFFHSLAAGMQKRLVGVLAPSLALEPPGGIFMT